MYWPEEEQQAHQTFPMEKKTGWINSQNNHQCSQDACFFSFIQPPEINMLKKV